MSRPLVSILMPAYNAEKYIREAIKSILEQSYIAFELLICNDGSKDSTLNILNSFTDKRIRVYVNEQNIGEIKTRNFLLKEARGEFIAFQDADDWSSPNRIEKQVKELLKNKKLGLVGCQTVYVRENGKLIRISKKPTSYKGVLSRMYKYSPFGGPLVMFRKKVLEEVGDYRAYFNRMAYHDYDLLLRIAEKHECYNLNEGLYFYRQIGTSASKEVNINKFLAYKVVQHLAHQRRLRGNDDLEVGNIQHVDAYFNELRKPYQEDPSLIYRDYSASFMYSNLYLEAVTSALNAVAKKPLRWVNWRTLQYCIRKSVLS